MVHNEDKMQFWKECIIDEVNEIDDLKKIMIIHCFINGLMQGDLNE